MPFEERYPEHQGKVYSLGRTIESIDNVLDVFRGDVRRLSFSEDGYSATLSETESVVIGTPLGSCDSVLTYIETENGDLCLRMVFVYQSPLKEKPVPIFAIRIYENGGISGDGANRNAWQVQRGIVDGRHLKMLGYEILLAILAFETEQAK